MRKSELPGILALLLPILGIGVFGAGASAQERIQNFTFTRRVDPLTDEDRSFLSTRELHPTPLRTGSLVWRCSGAELGVYLAADEFLNLDDPVRVQWRFDENPASGGVNWSVSTDGDAAFLPESRTLAFTGAAKRASSVFIRVTDYRGTPHDYDFSLMGLTAGLGRISCAPSPEQLAQAAAIVAPPQYEYQTPSIRFGTQRGIPTVWMESQEQDEDEEPMANIRWTCNGSDTEVLLSVRRSVHWSRLYDAGVETVMDGSSPAGQIWGPLRAGKMTILRRNRRSSLG